MGPLDFPMKERLTGPQTFTRHVLAFVLLFVCGMLADTATSQSYNFPSKETLIGFLTDTIDWYRNSSAQQRVITEPSDLLFLQEAQALGIQIAQFSFEYAKADAALQATDTVSPDGLSAIPDTSSSDLQHFVRMRKAYVAEAAKAQSDLDSLQKNLARAHLADRKRLEAAIADTKSRLDILQAQSNQLQSLVEFVRTTGNSESLNGDLPSIIDNLSRTVPGLNVDSKPGMGTPQTVTTPDSFFKSADSGILGLISEVSACNRELQTLDKSTQLTDRLAQSSKRLQAPLAQFINKTLESGGLQGADPQTTDTNVLASARKPS